MSGSQILEQALDVKLRIDELALLGDKLYICLSCQQVNTYFTTCETCEEKAAYFEKN
jgi:hypothetical protein